MSDDKIYCKVITKVVKRQEAMDGHKIMNHSKSHEQSQKFERRTTKIMSHTNQKTFTSD